MYMMVMYVYDIGKGVCFGVNNLMNMRFMRYIMLVIYVVFSRCK